MSCVVMTVDVDYVNFRLCNLRLVIKLPSCDQPSPMQYSRLALQKPRDISNPVRHALRKYWYLHFNCVTVINCQWWERWTFFKVK